MPLQKQPIHLPFNSGINTKSDPKQISIGQLAVLENGIFTSTNELRKRNGYAGLSTATNTNNVTYGFSAIPSNISNGSYIASYNNEDVIGDGLNLFSFSESNNAWIYKGRNTIVQTESTSIQRSIYSQTMQDSAIDQQQLALYAWEDSSGGVRYSIVDNNSGQVTVSNVLVSTTSSRPRCIGIAGKLLLFYFESATNSLNYIQINQTGIQPFVELFSDINSTNPNYDVEVFNNNIYVAYNGNAQITVGFITPYLAVSTLLNIADVATNCISIFTDPTLNIWICYNNGTDTKCAVVKIVNNTWTTVLAATIVDSGSTASGVHNITGAYFNSTVGAVIFYDQLGSKVNGYYSNALINYNTISITGTLGTVSTYIKSAALASKAFSILQNNVNVPYVMVVHDAVLQPTYFLSNLYNVPTSGQAANIAAKVFESTSGGVPVKSMLPRINQPTSSNIFELALLQKDLLYTSTGSNGTVNTYTNNGVSSVSFDFTQTNPSTVVLGNNLHVGSGILAMYDGSNVVEHGFHFYPEGVSLAGSTTGGGMTSVVNGVAGSYASYAYQVVYEWTDNQGQLHRSSPSPIVSNKIGATPKLSFTSIFASGATSITVSSAAGLFVGQQLIDSTTSANLLGNTYITAISGTTVTLSNPTQGASASTPGDSIYTMDTNSYVVTIPTLQISAKEKINIVLYRSAADGTVYYRLNLPNAPIVNDTSVSTITYTDTANDITLYANEQLYTTGGEVENIAAPSSKIMTTYLNRVILVPSNQPTIIWYSKQVILGSPVEFSDFFTVNIGSIGGPITAIAQMEGYLLIFTENQIYYMSGNGPTPAGTENDFSTPLLMPVDGGCVDANSIVQTPTGLLYKSAKGIYSMSRFMMANYVGMPVEKYNSNSITSTQLMPNSTQCVFTLDNGQAMLFDYYFNQWSIFTNFSTVSSSISNQLLMRITSNGQVMKETPGVFVDNGNFISLKIVTAWLNFAGLQGYQRVYKALILGTYIGPHNLICQVAYDYNPTNTQIDYIPAGSALNPLIYGMDSVYGADTVYGGNYPQYQWQIKFSQQKCESLQITLQDSQGTAPITNAQGYTVNASYNEGFRLSGLSFEVGMKQGLNKLPASKTYG